ncbi:MAG: D-alanyl-D-alanine carboxypeptidase/D-alanyl-D-alanine-endopeptidase [Phycisphaerales bacterium]
MTSPPIDIPARSPLIPASLAAAASSMALALALASSSFAGLADEIRTQVNRAALKDAALSVCVRDADTDRVLVAMDADRPMIPASNMKVFTSGAALHTLGPDFTFRTQAFVRRDVAKGIEGDRDAVIAVVGDGDPALADPELLAKTTWTDSNGQVRLGMTADDLVGLWVDAARKAGIRSVKEVIVDDRVFARELFHPSWPADQSNQRSFAEVAGLNFQTNLLQFLPRPGNGPRPDLSDIRPRAPWISIENKATTRNGKPDKQSVWVVRDEERNAYSVHGNVKFNVAEPIEIPLHDPPLFFAQLLADRLRGAGIPVAAARVARNDDPVFAGPAGAAWGAPLGATIQTPIAAVLERCNTDSQNLYAESLFKRAGRKASGRPGSWSTGAEAVRTALAGRVHDASLTKGVVVSDGSGLSRQNRVNASLVTAWLDTFHRDTRLGSIFVDSLAVGGESGTLRNRFGKLDRDVTVQCKTGYINGVSCLSGFVTTSDGRRRSFSVLGNNLIQPGAVAKAKKLQEAIVETIAEDMKERAALGGG